MDQDIWNRDESHLAQGARMIAAALVSAVLTATLVIAVGQAVVERHTPQPARSDALLVRTSH